MRKILCFFGFHSYFERSPKTQVESNYSSHWIECKHCHERLHIGMVSFFGRAGKAGVEPATAGLTVPDSTN